MAHEQHTYICIDLKTFYASVECVDRGLDPLTTCLVVADESRGRTTIPCQKGTGFDGVRTSGYYRTCIR